MLKRIYVNNYRCMVNFEINFDKINILIGPNGSGKSSLFDLLYNIQRFIVDNVSIADLFHKKDLTVWVNKLSQSFELDVHGENGLYTYKLMILHNTTNKRQRIELEELFLNGKPLFEYKEDKVCLYHDDHTISYSYPFNWNLSAFAIIETMRDNKKLEWFQNWIKCLFIINLQPKVMYSETAEDHNWLNPNGSNFASWYRYLSQEHQDKMFILTEKLRNIIPGFYAFRLEQKNKLQNLKVGFKDNNIKSKPVYFNLNQLSDGQRVMIILNTLILGSQDFGWVLFLDNPENYMSLAEIQPMLMKLRNACDKNLIQSVFISHHPELIDYFASKCGIWVEREPLGPTKIKSFQVNKENGLKISELIARGWIVKDS